VEIVLVGLEELFIYGRLLQENLTPAGGGLTLMDLPDKTTIFPERLDRFHGKFFERLIGALKNVSLLDVFWLGPMCVAREPPSLDCCAARDEKNMTKVIMIEVQQLLILAGDEIRFMHKSMSDYLQDPPRKRDETMRIDEEKSRMKLAILCSENLEKSGSAALNVVFIEAGKRELLSEMLCDFTWSWHKTG